MKDFDYILDINFSREKENIMEIKKYNASVMDDKFDNGFMREKDKNTLRFEHSHGYSYGANDTSNTFWFPKTNTDCENPFFKMDEAKNTIKGILSEFIFEPFSFRFKVIVDGEEFRFGV